LRRLALERGESFATPQTRAQASREIARLKARERSTRTERAVERRQVSRDLAASGDVARVRDSEITGYVASQRHLAPEGGAAMNATATPTQDGDHRAKGRPVGTYTTDAGARRRVWRQRGRDGIRLVDVADGGRGRRYLIERAMTAGEADALAADYLTEAAELGDCPMRTSRVARALEAMR
jgi:hypothetical protein